MDPAGKNEGATTASLVAQAERHVALALGDDCTGHDHFHADRVRRMALRLLAEEGSDADAEVVELAALLHDIGDAKLTGGEDCSGAAARELIEGWGGGPELAARVADAIGRVSYKGGFNADEGTSAEAALVRDADRLDALGAIGMARTFAYGGRKERKIYDPAVPPATFASEAEYRAHQGTSINHFFEKLLLLPATLASNAAKRIARRRIALMRRFLLEFVEECGLDSLRDRIGGGEERESEGGVQ